MPTPHSSTAPPAEFPQPHSGLVIEGLLGLVKAIQARAGIVAQIVPAQPVLDNCQFEEEGWPCYHPAVVFHLQSELEFCRKHFQGVERG